MLLRGTSPLVTRVQAEFLVVYYSFETYDGGVPGVPGELVQRPNHRVADFFAQMDDFVRGHPNAKVCPERVRVGLKRAMSSGSGRSTATVARQSLHSRDDGNGGHVMPKRLSMP